eukprot:CAMPEP_0172674830 /NCGR_PEP_ID=MMETSP1074-20121228/12946_1 /TAXON_ID=2916 /ORGANISM="Ceratium fusus, Strain PA161109" /LENGTH=292 /DNA_ID=CAMNT_0013492267 /DNA_START=80 /DNA_END=958 /DNA_ORIENTATION=-
MATPCNKLKVHIIRAEGLQCMNHFTGDHPYVTCEIKRADGGVESRADTKPVTEGDTLNPVWDETLELEFWQQDETLEFTVNDQGLLGAKTEGKALLPSEFFYPHGFQGMLAIIGLPDAKLGVDVQVVGAQDGEQTPEQYPPAVSQRLGVSILQAHGLNNMTHFTGDSPYIICEVKHLDPASKMTRVETASVTDGDTSNPFWGETHIVEPWCEGEPLQFTVCESVASKKEGKAELPSKLFFPHGYAGFVAIDGSPQAILHIIVRPLGPAVGDGASLKTNQVKVSQTKGKHCCW